MKISASLVASALISAGSSLQAHARQVPLAITQFSSHFHDPVLSPELRERIGEILDGAGVVGYSLGIFRADAKQDEEYAQWGLRTEAGAPVTKETIQFIGSLSKAFAATALGLVMDDFANSRNSTALPDGLTEFTWDTKIINLLPEDWKLMDEWALAKTSVRDALSHVSGLSSHDLSYRRNDTSLDVIRRMRYLRPSWELRQRWEYNNQQYIVAQHLMERYSGHTLDDFVAQRIFAPLNMSSSSYSPTQAKSTGHLSEARDLSGRRIPLWFIDADIPILGGAGGVLSSAPDLLKWAKALLGVTNTTSLGIPRSVLEESMSAQSLMDKTSRATYGFGWGQRTEAGFEIVVHSGGLPGVSTRIALIPALKAAVVLLASSSDVHDANTQIVSEIIRSISHGAFSGASRTKSAGSNVQFTSQLLQTGTSLQSTLTFRHPVDHYAGLYHDPAYGDIIVCPVSPHNQDEECREMTNDFAAIGVKPGPVLLAKFRRQSPWADYLSFTPTEPDGLSFSLRASTIFPQGYGEDTSPFSVVAADDADDAGGSWQIAQDGTVTGFGLYDSPGARSERHKKGTTVQEKAQVWFERKG